MPGLTVLEKDEAWATWPAVSIESIASSGSAPEGELPVRVVLEDPEVVFVGELDQAPTLLQRERATGRVVGVGDDVDELDRPVGERRLERRDVDPVVLQADRHQLGAELLEQQQGAVVGRLLD